MINNFSLLSYGRVYKPYDWYYNPLYVINRVYYIVSGTAYYKDTVQLKPGYVYVFRAAPDFRVCQDENDPVDHVFFDFHTYRGILEQDYIEIDVKSDIRLEGIVHAICEDFNSRMDNSDIAGKYLEIILYYLKDRLNSDSSYSDVTLEALKILHEADVSELSVNLLADLQGRNVNHIIRCFKKDIGITPHRYIAMLKTNMAIAYIDQGHSCSEVAEKLGFGSIAAFSYYFKHETGKNYMEYKQNVSNNKSEGSRFFDR